jgi:aquaporin Z
MFQALRRHWPEYLMEAAGLGLFMISAGFFATLLESPASPARHAVSQPLVRRALMGLAMGFTAMGLIYSPWGKQSGAHLNPAVTLTFWRLGKVANWDALFYVLAQFLGGLLGVLLLGAILGASFLEPPVSAVATVPGEAGDAVAFLAEWVIALLLMLVVLFASNTPRLASSTGFFAGLLLAVYIFVEAPLSGTSMNPARTFASALPARIWTAAWVYFTAPFVGMLVAAQVYSALKGRTAVACAKLHHRNAKRCIFCEYHSSGRIAEDVSDQAVGPGRPGPSKALGAFPPDNHESLTSAHRATRTTNA